MIVATIYCVTHASRPCDGYIGQTMKNPLRRLGHHRSRVACSDLFLYRWWRKRVAETGVEPEMTIVVQRTFDDRAAAVAWLNAIEQEDIAWARAQSWARCLNMTAGGDGGLDPSLDVRAKLSTAARKHWADPDIRAKMIEALRGRDFSLEHRAKLSQAHRGKTLSPEHRARLSEARRGKKFSPEHRMKISKARQKYEARKHTEGKANRGSVA